MGEGLVKPETKQLVMEAIQAHFPPEFIDEVVIFMRSPFSFRSDVKDMLGIVKRIRLQEVNERLAERKIKVDIN